MEGILPIIINLISGAGGGTLAGKLLKNFSLGGIGNALVGILGGGIGGQALSALGLLGGGGDAMSAGGGMDIGSILGSVVGSGIGGSVLMVVIGFIKKMISGNK